MLAAHHSSTGGFDVRPARHPDRGAGPGVSGRPQWEESAKYYISGLGALTASAYASLAPVQWPVRAACGNTPRLLGDGRFFHADGRARGRALARTPARRRLDRCAITAHDQNRFVRVGPIPSAAVNRLNVASS